MAANEISNETLIEKAISVVNPHIVGDRLFGDVGCALVTDQGHVYVGVCIDTASGTGFCAEHSAIAAMVTAGEYRIRKIVAVWLDDNSEPHILSPCGRCRELIRQVDPENMQTEIILNAGKSVPLTELLPYSDWFARLDK